MSHSSLQKGSFILWLTLKVSWVYYATDRIYTGHKQFYTRPEGYILSGSTMLHKQGIRQYSFHVSCSIPIAAAHGEHVTHLSLALMLFTVIYITDFKKNNIIVSIVYVNPYTLRGCSKPWSCLHQQFRIKHTNNPLYLQVLRMSPAALSSP